MEDLYKTPLRHTNLMGTLSSQLVHIEGSKGFSLPFIPTPD